MQQGNKAKTRGKLIITFVALAVLAIIVLGCLPVLQIPVEVTETYYETEYQAEPYTEIETYTVPITDGSGGVVTRRLSSMITSLNCAPA